MPVFDTTFGFFVRLKYGKQFDGVLATPMTPLDVARGEVLWAVLRGVFYSACFEPTMLVMGLIELVVGTARRARRRAHQLRLRLRRPAASTFMRSFVDFDWVNVALLPLFLFSTIFFPLSRYPESLQRVVQCTPLYQGVAVERELAFGAPGVATLVHIAYLVALGAFGLVATGRRMEKLLLT